MEISYGKKETAHCHWLDGGTSMDGVDAALIETDGNEVFSLGASISIPYHSDFRDRLRAIMGGPLEVAP